MHPRRLIQTLFVGVILAASASQAQDLDLLTTAVTTKDSRLEKLARELGREVSRDAEAADSWRDLGIVQARLGLAEDAVASFDRARELNGGGEDMWARAFHAVAFERLGSTHEAAELYRGIELGDAVLDARLRARAELLDVGVGPALGGDGPKLAMLAPSDELGGHPEWPKAIVGAFVLGAEAMGLSVLGPETTLALLEDDGRSLEDLLAPDGRRRVGRTLRRDGVDALLTGLFIEQDGTVLTAFALSPVSAEGLDDARSYDGQAQVGRELEFIPALVFEVSTALGIEDATAAAAERRVPGSIESVLQLMQAHVALSEGNPTAALEFFAACLQEEPGLTDVAILHERLAAVQEHLGEPLASDLSSPVAVIEALVTKAKRTVRKKRSFDDD